MMLSGQTLEGLEITVRTIVELVPYLLRNGVSFVLTSVFNQDVLEQHFGYLRKKGGAHDNPTVVEAGRALNEQRLMHGQAFQQLRGNVQADANVFVDNTPLERRRGTR